MHYMIRISTTLNHCVALYLDLLPALYLDLLTVTWRAELGVSMISWSFVENTLVATRPVSVKMSHLDAGSCRLSLTRRVRCSDCVLVSWRLKRFSLYWLLGPKGGTPLKFSPLSPVWVYGVYVPCMSLARCTGKLIGSLGSIRIISMSCGLYATPPRVFCPAEIQRTTLIVSANGSLQWLCMGHGWLGTLSHLKQMVLPGMVLEGYEAMTN